ncbi:Phosphoribosylglycinamide formyltransferase 2 [Corynebacterium capitovis DSM 44611]|uniref:ATP-grasp domain-containing protein n=1 Tax=Corynebacterium capitovis TaxID=131081 RepID=UPI000374F663|nr:ATP-grasp domain-containing protein [Corynebacterium capitovis]WKD58216.1 Phosphoribosylglycinamide formyltransferase 2 [Corynebacterium capitovis DSM 44611]
MAAPDRNQVLILGGGALAHKLAASFRDLGVAPHVGSLEGGVPAHLAYAPPALTVVCEPASPEQLSELEDATGSFIVPSVEACAMTRNREGVRRTAAEQLGLPTLDYEFAGSFEELQNVAEVVGYPCVVKPGTSTGGRGQTVVTGSDDLAEAWEKAYDPSRDGRVGVEKYVAFDYECTILAARSIDPQTGQLATWFCEPTGTRHEGGRLVEAWQPAALSEAAMDNARSIAARIMGAIAARGLYAIDLFVSGDDVYFSQVCPRPCLDGMLTAVTQRVGQFDLHARAVLGLPIDVTLVTPGAARVVEGTSATPEELAAAMSVEETSAQVLDDVICVLSTGETVDEARARAEAGAAALG